MFKLRIAAAVLTSFLFSVDFTIAKATGGQLDSSVAAAWLLSLGWVFGGAAKDAIQRRNGDD
jgi:hypothetical protein